MLFADGLTDWIRGEETDEATAAAVNLADILLYVRAWLQAQFKK